MPTKAEINALAGSAIAAFHLAQFSFGALVKNGIVPKSEAEQILQQAVKVNRTGGPGNQIAADMLATVLQKLSSFQPPTRQ
jgi:hypothetical protein